MPLAKNALTAMIAMVLLTVLLGIVYPLVVTGISQVAFPGNANGQQVKVGGRLIGSKLIGGPFADEVMGKNGKPKLDKNGNPVTNPDPRYFQPRPSATTPAYNAAATTFSNLGPNNRTAEAEIAGNVQSYLALERTYVPGLTAAGVPVDAATSSASGVDPQISPANAAIQAHRVAAVRHLALARVQQLIASATQGRSLGIFGDPGVNVTELNLALDRAARTVSP